MKVRGKDICYRQSHQDRFEIHILTELSRIILVSEQKCVQQCIHLSLRLSQAKHQMICNHCDHTTWPNFCKNTCKYMKAWEKYIYTSSSEVQLFSLSEYCILGLPMLRKLYANHRKYDILDIAWQNRGINHVLPRQIKFTRWWWAHIQSRPLCTGCVGLRRQCVNSLFLPLQNHFFSFFPLYALFKL